MNATSLPPSHESSQAAIPSEAPPLRLSERPSWWLRAGFVRYEHSQGWAWIHVQADRPIDPASPPLTAVQLDLLFCDERARSLLVCLANAFTPLLPLTAAQWELDIRQSPCPETLLRLWETVLGVYAYYVADKRLPPGAAADYLLLILDFCNTGADDFLRTYQLRSLKPARVTRVIGELGRWFRREGSL